MENPFHTNYADEKDLALLQLALGGDRRALQHLIDRHQIFVYNLALKMTKNIQDAEDLTQEVFIKAITALSQYRANSQFRTWLYRICVNHFLTTKKRSLEIPTGDFESYFKGIEVMPDSEPGYFETDNRSNTVEELRISCTAGMLLCLDKQQRLIYILGELFEIDHRLGAEIMGVTPGNFRIRLMRARKDLYNWMNKRCGLVNKSNSCRCEKKTRAYVEAGRVDPNNLLFTKGYTKKIYEVSHQNAGLISNTVEDLYKEIFQGHPLHEPLTAARITETIFNNEVVNFVLKT